MRRMLAFVPLLCGVAFLSSSAFAQNVEQAMQECAFSTDINFTISCWAKYVQSYQNFAIGYAHLGGAYKKKGDFEKAVQAYTRAFELNPQYTVAINLRGEVYEKIGKRDLAIADFQNAVAMNPNYVAAQENLKRLSQTASVSQVQPNQSAATAKPSFDCSKATSASARLICSDAELSKADGVLGAKFKAAIGAKDQVTKKRLIEEQLTWIRGRNSQCGVGPDKSAVPTEQLSDAKPCMLQATNERITFLTTAETAPTAAAAPAPANRFMNSTVKDLFGTLPPLPGSVTVTDTATAAQPLPLMSSDPPDARQVLQALGKLFLTSEFCRKQPVKVINLGSEEWASVSFFDNDTCMGRKDLDSHTVILRKAQADAWSIKCKETRGDLPPYDYYFKQCGGMPRVAYAELFGVALPSAVHTDQDVRTKRAQCDAEFQAKIASGDLPKNADRVGFTKYCLSTQSQPHIQPTIVAGGCKPIKAVPEFSYFVGANCPVGLATLQRTLPPSLYGIPWIYNLDGVGGALIELTIDNKRYLAGEVCKPHDCHDNIVAFIIASDGSRAVAQTRLNGNYGYPYGYASQSDLIVLKRLLDWHYNGGENTSPAQLQVALQKLFPEPIKTAAAIKTQIAAVSKKITEQADTVANADRRRALDKLAARLSTGSDSMPEAELKALEKDARAAVEILDEAAEFKETAETTNQQLAIVDAALKTLTFDAPLVQEIRATISLAKKAQADADLRLLKEALSKLALQPKQIRRLKEAKDHGFDTIEAYDQYEEDKRKLSRSGIRLNPR